MSFDVYGDIEMPFYVLERSDLSGISSCVTILSEPEKGIEADALFWKEKEFVRRMYKQNNATKTVAFHLSKNKFLEVWPQVKECFLRIVTCLLMILQVLFHLLRDIHSGGWRISWLTLDSVTFNSRAICLQV